MKEHIAEIVAAYVGNNTFTPDQLPALITSVTEALARLGQPPTAPAADPTPAVPVRRSIGADKITCLDCGWSGQMLNRHLRTRHDTTPAQYRKRWELDPNYPMTAKNYAARRSELAKAIGLGTHAGSRH